MAGVSHFLEHLLFKGSSTRSAQDIAQGIDAVGGDLNVHVQGVHRVSRSGSCLGLDFGLNTLLDVLVDPGFTETELDAERRVILEELAWSADTPDDVVHGVLAESLFRVIRSVGKCSARPTPCRRSTLRRFGRSTTAGTGGRTW